MPITCPNCGSTAIFRFQRDTDWGGGSYYDTVNGEGYIDGKEYETPDVEVFHCGACGFFFDPQTTFSEMSVVPAEKLQDRIQNLKDHVQWLTKQYKQSCETAKLKVAKASYPEMAKAAQQLEDLSSMYKKLVSFEEQISTLEHILKEDSHSVQVLEQQNHSMPSQITSFRGKYLFLSNFYSCTIVYNGRFYRSAEASFQAQKTTSEKERQRFTNLSASEAKKLGQSLRLRQDWDRNKVSIMEEIVKAKFLLNKDLRVQLLATGNAHLQEMNTWGDTFWGTDMNGRGENHLGQILMRVREILQKMEESKV